MADEKPIIIMKKKGGHGGHHGGAWKVAYADFVTAMMAFFMVMWLLNSAEVATKQTIASYFRRPGVFITGSGTPLMMGGSGILNDGFYPQKSAPPKPFTAGREQVAEKKQTGELDAQLEEQYRAVHEAKGPVETESKKEQTGFGLVESTDHGRGDKNSYQQDEEELKEKLAEKIKQEIKSNPQLQRLLGKVDVKIEADGVNIEIMDTANQSMFASGSSKIEPLAENAFRQIAEILKPLPNTIDIVGHTDSKPFARGFQTYTNWELSADRANAARRLMQVSGIDESRITSVNGRADKELRFTEDPLDPRNRRISLKVKFPNVIGSPKFSNDANLKDNLAAAGNSKAQVVVETPVPATPEPVHAFSAEEIVKQSREPAVIELPKEGSSSSVFNEFPVIRPGSLLNGQF